MAPTLDELEDLVLSARYGDVEDVQAFADVHGWDAAAAARDDRGNSALHMACGNGHVDVLKLILSNTPAAALTTLIPAKNEAGSPAVHWAVLNNHVACVQALVEVPEESGGGIQVLKQTNAANRDAFAEALFAGEGKEEVAGWIEGYLWKIEGDDGDDAEGAEGSAAAEGEGAEVTVASAGEVDGGVPGAVITASATDENVPSRDEEGTEPVDGVEAVAAKAKGLAV